MTEDSHQQLHHLSTAIQTLNAQLKALLAKQSTPSNVAPLSESVSSESHHRDNRGKISSLSDHLSDDDDAPQRPALYPRSHRPQIRVDGLEHHGFDETGILDTLKLTKFEGFYNLAALLAVTSLVLSVVRDVQDKGLLIEWGDFTCPQIFRDIGTGLALTAASLTLCFTGFGLLWLWSRAYLAWHTLLLASMAVQSIVVLLPMGVLYATPTGPMASAVVMALSLVLVLKLHSYVMTNYAMAREHSARYGARTQKRQVKIRVGAKQQGMSQVGGTSPEGETVTPQLSRAMATSSLSLVTEPEGDEPEGVADQHGQMDATQDPHMQVSECPLEFGGQPTPPKLRARSPLPSLDMREVLRTGLKRMDILPSPRIVNSIDSRVSSSEMDGWSMERYAEAGGMPKPAVAPPLARDHSESFLGPSPPALTVAGPCALSPQQSPCQQGGSDATAHATSKPALTQALGTRQENEETSLLGTPERSRKQAVVDGAEAGQRASPPHGERRKSEPAIPSPIRSRTTPPRHAPPSPDLGPAVFTRALPLPMALLSLVGGRSTSARGPRPHSAPRPEKTLAASMPTRASSEWSTEHVAHARTVKRDTGMKREEEDEGRSTPSPHPTPTPEAEVEREGDKLAAQRNVCMQADAHAPIRGTVTQRRRLIRAWPANVKLADFGYFLLAPTLVYEPKYPRTRRIRWRYVAVKTVQAFVCSVLQYFLLKQFMLPVLQSPSVPLWMPHGLTREGTVIGAPDASLLTVLSWYAANVCAWAMDMSRLAVPSMAVWLLGFFALFHCALNISAELLTYGDRAFHSDWWNATRLDVFWRKWNGPVHEWCLRHLFVEAQHYAGVPKSAAVFATFLVSAMAHELLFSVSFKTFRPWFFLAMAAQLPLMALSQVWAGSRRGNLLVWWSLFSGQPLLELLYFREHFQSHKSLFCVG